MDDSGGTKVAGRRPAGEIPDGALAWRMLLMRVLAGVILFAAVSYLGSKVVGAARLGHTVDFPCLYAAGLNANRSVDPYDVQNARQTVADIVGTHGVFAMLYPPQMLGVVRPFAALPFEIAEVVYLVLSFLSLLAAAGICGRVVWRRAVGRNAKSIGALMLVAAVVLSMNPTVLMLYIAQTGWMPALGLALVIASELRCTESSRRINVGTVFGLVLLGLKPHLGLPILGFLIGRGRWANIAVAGVVSMLLLIVGGAGHSPLQLLSGFVENFDLHGELEFNQPASQTGIVVILATLGHPTGSTLSWVGIASVLGMILGWHVGRCTTAGRSIGQATAWVVVTMLVLMLVPLHTYDLVLLIPMGCLLLEWPRCWAIAGIVCLVAIGRANIIGMALPIQPITNYHASSLAATLTLTVLAIVGFTRYLLEITAVQNNC